MAREDQEKLYVELKSGAESGWDYSTRWFVNNNTNNGESMLYLKINSISKLVIASSGVM